MLTITVAVGLLPLVSTTVDAAEIDELPYIMVLEDTRLNLTWVYAASAPIRIISESGLASSSYILDFGVLGGYSLVQLAYNDELKTWNTTGIMDAVDIGVNYYYIYGESTPYTSGFVFWCDTEFQTGVFNVTTNYALNSNEQSVLAGYSNDMSSLPAGLTESDIHDIIDQQLNTQTRSGEIAEALNTQTQTVYAEYQSGVRTREEMQLLLDFYAEELSSLEPTTLLDAMQINNALTYNQTIQQIITSTSSTTVQEYILETLEPAISTFMQWQQGVLPLPDAMVEMEVPLANLALALVDGTAKTAADISAINTAMTFVQTLCENMSGSQDIDQSISEELQLSDARELDYFEYLKADAEKTISDIAPSKNFTQTQKNDAKELLDVIWENEFVKRLVPLCAGFMVVCVALGVKYKV